jgi:hypothetical protein
MPTKQPKNIEPKWRIRWCSGETYLPRKYRWEVVDKDGSASIDGYVKIAADTVRLTSNEGAGLTKEQAIAIASAMNALETIEEEDEE